MHKVKPLIADILTTASGAADYAANKSDRWLFICALLILIVGGVLAIRFLIRKLEENMQKRNEENEKHTNAFAAMAEKTVEANKQLAVVLDRNTTALNDCSTELRLCREERNR